MPARGGAPHDSSPARVVFQPNGRQGTVATGITLLEAARQFGVEIESICGGHQTCGKCRVVVEEGDFAKFGLISRAEHLTPPGPREQEWADKRNFPPGTRLSCACQITADVVIRVPEESQTRKQIVRKAAGVARLINVDAAMRLYYVELPPADLKDHRGDWERLRAELTATHGLTSLRVDLTVLRELQSALNQGNRGVTVTVLHDAPPADADGVMGRDEYEVVRVQPGFHDALYGVAVDVGTTTIAANLCNLRTGEIVAQASRMNPQVPYGEDLMSRISYAMMNDDGAERMHRSIIHGLNELMTELCAAANQSMLDGDATGGQPDEPLSAAPTAPLATTDIVELVLVGNTTMHHLLLGVSPVELGGAPFSLVTHDAINAKARDLGLAVAPGANVHFPPCEAGHVGSDNVGVLVAEAPYTDDIQSLILDIGTNGELLLGNRHRVVSASSPTGPAFEGAQIVHGMRAADGAIERVRIDPATLAVRYKLIGRDDWRASSPEAQPVAPGQRATAHLTREQRRAQRAERLTPRLLAAGICGSGIIEAIAELFLAGLIGPNGRFVDLAHPRLRTGLGDGGSKAEFVLAWPHETTNGQAVTVHSDDIRAIQLAKAALYAGSKLLMQRMDLTEVARVVLAGGFGSYIDPFHAMVLGLIPDCDLAQVAAVGNAAGDGARMILLDRQKRAEAIWAARWVTYVETAVEPAFQDEFVLALDIPHARDPYPHLADAVEAARTQWPPEREIALAALTVKRNARSDHEQRAARRARRAARRP